MASPGISGGAFCPFPTRRCAGLKLRFRLSAALIRWTSSSTTGAAASCNRCCPACWSGRC